MNAEKMIRDKIRMQGKSRNTADTYVGWVHRYFAYCKENRIGGETRAEVAVERFLSWLAVCRRVSASTQNQALQSICYFYRDCCNRPLVDVSALRSKRPDRVREVVDASELVALFAELKGVALLASRMMYGCGLRIGELGKIRMKDLSFERRNMTIREGKGKKDRIVQLPECLHEQIRRQMESIRVLWRHDVENELSGVSLPDAWGRKSPRSHLEFAWYYLFAADGYSRDPDTGRMFRHHRDLGHIGREIKQAVIRAGIPKRITAHCLRHSFATHSLDSGVPIHVVQALMGHNDIATTETYLHVTEDGPASAPSPLERLLESPKMRQTKPMPRIWPRSSAG